jgi:hypothetical protein
MKDWLEETVGFVLGLSVGVCKLLALPFTFVAVFGEVHLIWSGVLDNAPTLFVSGLVGGLGGAVAHIIRLVIINIFFKAKDNNKKDE